MALDTFRAASAAIAFGLSALAVCLATIAAACMNAGSGERLDIAPSTASALITALLAAMVTAMFGFGRLADPWLPVAAGCLLMAAIATAWLVLPSGLAARAVLLDGDAARLIGLPVRRIGLTAAAAAAACAIVAGIVMATGWPELPPTVLLSTALAGAGASGSALTVAAAMLAAAGGALAIGLVAAPTLVLPCCVLAATLASVLVHRHA